MLKSHHSASNSSRSTRRSTSKFSASDPESESELATETASTGAMADTRAKLSALEQNYGQRLADLEDRLTSVERTTADHTGQIQNMR